MIERYDENRSKKYLVKVNDVSIDDFPKKDFERNVHVIARSDIKNEDSMKGNKKEMKFPLLVHNEYVEVIVQHNSISKYTKF